MNHVLFSRMRLRGSLPRTLLIRELAPGTMTLRKSGFAQQPATPDPDVAPPRTIDFLLGWPNPGLLPPKLLQQAATNVLLDSREVITPILEYGADPGYLPLRKEVASWLTTFYENDISYERICISGGASQNLACILQTFTDPIYTRHIFMVAPAYYLACRIFADAGFDGRLRGVPEDAEGIDLDFLEKALETSERTALAHGNNEPKIKPPKPYRKIYKYIIYAVPQFSNPTGRIMSLSHRQSLIHLARKYDCLIITDDVYDMLQWPSTPTTTTPAPPLTKTPLPRLIDLDRTNTHLPFGNAISNGSFSKITGPGVRTGWSEATPTFTHGLSQTGSTRSGGSPSQLVASFLSNMLATNHLQQHISHTLQPAYARRYHIMISAINNHLIPLGLTMPQPDKAIAGGYFIWLTLPVPLQAETICERALKDEKVVIITGSRFRVEGDEENLAMRFERDFRLCFAWEEEDVMEEGIIRLARVVRRAMEA